MKSILIGAASIVAGIAVNIVLSLGLDAMFRGLGVLPGGGQPMTDVQHVLPFAYRIVIAVIGFYVTARLAPRRPLLHALLLATIAFGLTLMNTISTWHPAGSAQPQWFQLSMLVALFPLAWLGARLARR